MSTPLSCRHFLSVEWQSSRTGIKYDGPAVSMQHFIRASSLPSLPGIILHTVPGACGSSCVVGLCNPRPQNWFFRGSQKYTWFAQSSITNPGNPALEHTSIPPVAGLASARGRNGPVPLAGAGPLPAPPAGLPRARRPEQPELRLKPRQRSHKKVQDATGLGSDRTTGGPSSRIDSIDWIGIRV